MAELVFVGQLSLAKLLANRRIEVKKLSERVGITMINISILKNGKAKTIRFSGLNVLHKALDG